MPINKLNFLSFDFETGGLKPGFNEALSIGAKVYGPNFEPIGGDGGEFYSLMKPLHFDRLDAQAMEVNRITHGELKAAPDQGVVWKKFLKWCENWKVKGAGTFGGHPIAVGKNIRGFDLLFVDELNRLYATKKEKQTIFNRKILIDLEDELFRWFGFNNELPGYAMDVVRPYFGIPLDGGHNALVDAIQTGDMVMRFLKLYKRLTTTTVSDGNGGQKPMIGFKNSFAKANESKV